MLSLCLKTGSDCDNLYFSELYEMLNIMDNVFHMLKWPLVEKRDYIFNIWSNKWTLEILYLTTAILNFLDWCCHLYNSCNNGIYSKSISWESVYKVSHSCVDVLIFTSFLFWVVYLAWRNFMMDPTANVYQMLCKSPLKSATQTLPMIRQAFEEEKSMSRTWVFEWHAWFRADRKKPVGRRAKSRACPSFSLTSRCLFIKNSC
jgi:hypothetical protein